MNIAPTILRKKIEDLREAGAMFTKRCGVLRDERSALQPRRFMIASAAVGCKRLLDRRAGRILAKRVVEPLTHRAGHGNIATAEPAELIV